MTMTITKIKRELKPRYNNQKSFYKKAHTIQVGNVIQLQSYNTIVAEIQGGTARIHGTYSMTTLRHIKDFLYQHGFEVGTKAELEKMYMS